VNPLSRTAHRAKTHGGWKRVNLAPGHTEWTSPTGQRYTVDHGTTRDHGQDQPGVRASGIGSPG